MSRRDLPRFSGFPEGTVPTVMLPESIFGELLPSIDDPDELKVTLVVLWRLAKMRANLAPWVTDVELRADPVLRVALDGGDFERRLQTALSAAVDRGVLLVAEWQAAEGSEMRYFANSPRGRASVAAMGRGVSPERAALEARPDIFTLYEQTVGPLTALLSEELMEAEATYPAAWIEEAFREAARMNKRNWKYILAILERWRAEGKDEIDRGIGEGAGREAGQREREAEARRYIEERYDRLVRH